MEEMGVVLCRTRLRRVLLPLVLVRGCSQGTSMTVLSPSTTLLIVNGYTIESDADLSGADLTGRGHEGADLANANLANANLTGATMPDGTVHL